MIIYYIFIFKYALQWPCWLLCRQVHLLFTIYSQHYILHVGKNAIGLLFTCNKVILTFDLVKVSMQFQICIY